LAHPIQFTFLFGLASIGFALVLGVVSTPAHGNIYAYTDERGVTHFTNIPQTDRRYRVVYKDSATSPTRVRGLTGLGATATAPWKPSEADIKRFAHIIDLAAKMHSLDPALVHAVIRAESGYNPNAVSPKGASGLMQLIPATAQRYGVTNIFDPVENIYGGTRYLRDLLRMFNGNVELALAGYNAGENAVIRAGNRVPNYQETVAYVPKVMGFYRAFVPPKL
jgi:soluble lytic murein transglycosylase-like protein